MLQKTKKDNISKNNENKDAHQEEGIKEEETPSDEKENTETDQQKTLKTAAELANEREGSLKASEDEYKKAYNKYAEEIIKENNIPDKDVEGAKAEFIKEEVLKRFNAEKIKPESPVKDSLNSKSMDQPVAIHATDNTPAHSTVPIAELRDWEERIFNNEQVRYVAGEADSRAKIASVRGISGLKGFFLGIISYIAKNILNISFGSHSTQSSSPEYYISPEYYLEEGSDDLLDNGFDSNYEDNSSQAGQSNNQENQKSNRQTTTRNPMNLKRKAKNLRNSLNSAKKWGGKAKKAVKAVKTIKNIGLLASALSNPAVWVGLGVLVLFILMFKIMNDFAALCMFEGCNTTLQRIKSEAIDQAKLDIIKKDLSPNGQVGNGELINYELIVNYSGMSPVDIEVKDQVPAGTVYVSGQPEAIRDDTTDYLTWIINDVQPGTPPSPIKFTLRPIKNDFWVVNQAQARITRILSGIIDVLSGQGRTNIFTSRQHFVDTVTRNGVAYGLPSKISYLEKIYDVSIAGNINPLIILSLWGTETRFASPPDSLARAPFSCPPVRNINMNDPDEILRKLGFDNQLQCAVNTLNHWMNDFITKQKATTDGIVTLPSQIGDNCAYTDPLIYALEWYGPTCRIYDQNDYFHKNLINFYQQLQKP